MKNIMSQVASVVALAVVLGAYPQTAFADDAKARRIMEQVDAREDGDNITKEMEMILIDKNKNKRVRKIKQFIKDFGKDTHSLMFFLKPADVKNTGFLTLDYDDPKKDDDQFLYLPALKKTKRIATSDKSGSFMGSDFNYSDMTARDLEDYNFTLKKEVEVRGKKVWVIESIPVSKEVIDETGYAKSLLLVRQDNYVVVRAVNWVNKGGKRKYLDVKKLELIDGVWTSIEIHMTTKIGKTRLHKTILKFSNVKYNQGLDKEIFTVRRLEKGL